MRYTASIFRFLKRLFTARDGGVAIYVTFLAVVMMGFGALVVDAGRVYTLQTELQNATDAAALAGAAELDLTTTSITRARAAAKTAFVNNQQTYGSGGQAVVIQDSDIRFLTTLPANDDAPIPSSAVTTDPTKAKYIEVTSSVREVDYLLGPVMNALFAGDFSKGEAQASAVACLESVVCRFPPLMICNPAESNGNTGAAFNWIEGQLLKLNVSSGGGNWTPGNYGLLDPMGANQGTAEVQESLANHDPDTCFGTRVDLRTGQPTHPVSKAINTRFDIYENPGFGGGAKNNSAYKPAPNVIKGKYKSGASYTDYAGSPPAGRAMPKHPCYAAGNCNTLGPTFHPSFAPPPPANLGNQQSHWSDYWTTNHPSESFAGLYNNGSIDPNGDGIVTRKEMYDWENSANKIPVGDTDGDSDVDADDATTASSATGENGHPMEYGGSAAPDPNRRIIYVAVINCLEQGPLNGDEKDVPVLAWAKMFLTHAAEGNSEQTLYAEIVGILEPGADGSVLHDIVQLNR